MANKNKKKKVNVPFISNTETKAISDPNLDKAIYSASITFLLIILITILNKNYTYSPFLMWSSYSVLFITVCFMILFFIRSLPIYKWFNDDDCGCCSEANWD